MSDNFNIFDYMFEKYKITKPIRLIELFAGYGSQALSLKYLGVDFEHWKICEWATKSIQAYNDIHIKDYKDYSAKYTQEQIIQMLYEYGISMNYNEPMTLKQIKIKGEKWQRQTYNNIIANHNLVNIQNVKAKDLNIVDTDKYDYILTYSFPCQDLSLAGKGKGMSRDSGTRSGMLWQVERILKECKNIPQILLMENVPEVVGEKNIKDFRQWVHFLESKGYSNNYQILNAKDYGIPQNRARCFMVSILGDYSYNFPKGFKLKYILKDLLENNVDEKYFLSDKMIQGMINTKFSSYKLENKIIGQNGIASTILARFEGAPQCIAVKEATKKGYAEAQDGDGVYINRPHQKRGVVQKGMIQTIKTSPDVGVVVKDKINVIGNYSPSGHNAASIVDSEGIAPTVMENHGTVTAIVENEIKNYPCYKCKHWISEEFRGYCTLDKERKDLPCDFIELKEKYIEPKCLGGFGKVGSTGQFHQQNRVYDDKVAISVTTGFNPYYKDNLRIRKLTPKECFRLMGVKDTDFINAAKNQSDSSLYHLAGDSIVTTCLMAIFGELLGIDYIEKINQLLNEIKN